jgi:hypothetical protein
MRAITLHQPIASAVALGLKTIETRSWSTAYRGPIVIHAALDAGPARRAAWAAMHADDRAVFAAAGYQFLKALPLMRPVAVAHLCAVIPVDYLESQSALEQRWGDFGPGRFAWVLRNIRPVLAWPRPVTGYQGLWHWRHGDLEPHLGPALLSST